MNIKTRSSLVTLAIVLLGLAVLALGLGQAMGGSGSSDWPTTNGVIVQSLVETLTDMEGKVTYAPGVAYSYEVEGMVFPYNHINYQESTDRSRAEEVVARYPLGMAVTVYYDPADPSQSTLEPGWAGSTWVLIAVGAGMALVGLFGLAYVRTSKNEVSGVLMRRSSFRRYGGGLSWQPCPGPELAPGEEVLWKGRPVKGAFLLSSSRQSSLQGVPVMALGLILLVIGLSTGSGLAVVGGVLFAVPLVFMALSIRANLRDLPMVEHVLTDSRALTRHGKFGEWYCVPLSGVTQVLMAQNLSDRIFRSGSLVFTDTAVVDFFNIREPERVRGLMLGAMRKNR